MKLRYPKELKAFQFRRLSWFELNDFDADLVFPSLYGLIVTGGQRHKNNKLVRHETDPDGAQSTAVAIAPEELIDSLSRDEHLEGFDSAEGRALLREWIHSTVAKIGSTSRARRGETVQHIQPIHLATYSAGLPSTPGLKRDADLALYAALEAHVRTYESEAPLQILVALFKESLGKGANYGSGQDSFRPHYDGVTPLDLTTLVTMRYLDQFETPPLQAGAPQRRTEAQRATPFLIPASMDALAQELLGYLAAYRHHLPASTISQALVAQASLGLLRYFLQTVTTTARMMEGARQGDAIALPSALEIYADTTGQRGSPSDQLARVTVNRDLSRLARFFGHVQTLRTLDLLVTENADLSAMPLLDQFECELDEYRANPDVLADARHLIRTIRELNTEGEDAQCTPAEFTALTSHLEDPLDKLSVLLGMRGSNSGVTNFVKWYRTSGGLMKNYGILDGNLTGRKNWRYFLTDELLSVLVQQAFVVRPIPDLLAGGLLRPKISLKDFLAFLESSYGIIIDRPPADSDNPNTRRAAAENLEALKTRLRQMGYFQLLSDDFSAQYLRNPLFKDAA